MCTPQFRDVSSAFWKLANYCPHAKSSTIPTTAGALAVTDIRTGLITGALEKRRIAFSFPDSLISFKSFTHQDLVFFVSETRALLRAKNECTRKQTNQYLGVMMDVESEGCFVNRSIDLNTGETGPYSCYPNAPLLDGFSDTSLERCMAGTDSAGEQYYGGEVSQAIHSSASTLSGEQIFQEAMKYVQEQTEGSSSDNLVSADYPWQGYSSPSCKCFLFFPRQ